MLGSDLNNLVEKKRRKIEIEVPEDQYLQTPQNDMGLLTLITQTLSSSPIAQSQENTSH